MVRHPAGETITVTREGSATGTYDDQGNEIHAAPATFDVTDVAIAPAGSEETAEAPGIYVITGYDLYCPWGTVLLAEDLIEIRGVAGWQVTGDSTQHGWRNPFTGDTPGVVVNVKRSS